MTDRPLRWPNGARVALFGRKINNAEHQLAFIEMLRLIFHDRVPVPKLPLVQALREAGATRIQGSLFQGNQGHGLTFFAGGSTQALVGTLDDTARQRAQDVAAKAQSTWDRFRRERDFHRMHHKRVVQEKNKFVVDIKRLKSHYEQYEPTLQELRFGWRRAPKSTTVP